MASQAVLITEDLSLHYGAHHVLKPLNIVINSGELIAIIGPNGAGKTSLIKSLCGRVTPKGQIYITGEELGHKADRRAFIGLVPQDIGLYPHLSAKENLQVIARLLKVPAKSRKEAVQEALDAVGMSAKSDARVSTLSGGMKRRINVAAAIMNKPPLLIFDEPTAGVDIPARDVVHRLARELADKGMTVLLVTHELEQAEALCDRVLVLSEGQKLAFDTPAAILSQAYGQKREVVVRFTEVPNAQTLTSMQPFAFRQGELPTIWQAVTNASEVSFVSAFMTTLKGGNENIREITVRRPGLNTLMHHIENTGELPQ